MKSSQPFGSCLNLELSHPHRILWGSLTDSRKSGAPKITSIQSHMLNIYERSNWKYGMSHLQVALTKWFDSHFLIITKLYLKTNQR